ncbi:hypothetical protein P12x_004936 [Tundrisphaera lichenicola]|uniref:hypothetical protein n=1 Tax=Tundrisphaera lichenicola TaxID=2029860 RepID=UPI003EB9AC90
MQGRSWMAALALVAASAGYFGPATLAGQPTPIKQTVNLVIRLDGISSDGAEVVIKPGHPACRFKPITKKVTRNGKLELPKIDVETISADRDCAFAITLKEPGQPDKVVRRNLRIEEVEEGKSASPQSLTCYVSSNSLHPTIAEKTDRPKIKK